MRQLVCKLLAILFLTSAAFSAAPVKDDKPTSTVDSIRKALLSLPYYSVFDYIEFKLDGRTVTLLGAVTRPALKSDAEAVVHHVKGVEEVVNNIEVLPLSTADDRIRRAVYQTVFSQDGLSRYSLGANPSIHIIVKNGNVTLKGIVDNQGDKNLAGIQARSVGGTFAVKNELRVAPRTEDNSKKRTE